MASIESIIGPIIEGLAGSLMGTPSVALPSVTRPSITAPTQGATDVSLTPALESSAFASSDGLDTHASSDWQVSDGVDILEESLADAANLESYTVTTPLDTSTEIFVRVQHYGTLYGASGWSDWVSFTTTAVTFSAESEAFFARLNTQPSTAWKVLIDDLINTLVNTNGTWAELDAIILGDLPDEADAVLDASGADNDMVNFGAVHTPGSGWVGPASGAGLELAATFTKLTQNDAHFSVYQTAQVGSGDVVGATRLSIRNRTASTLFRVCDASTALAPSPVAVPAFICVRRSGASATNVRINGSTAATATTASVAVPSTPINILNGNQAGLRALTFGSNLTDAQEGTLRTALLTYFAGVDALP